MTRLLQFVCLGLVSLLLLICYVVWSYRPARPDLLEYKYGGTACDIRSGTEDFRDPSPKTDCQNHYMITNINSSPRITGKNILFTIHLT